MSLIETERMRLRRLTMEDVDNLLGIFSDPEAMRFYPAIKDRVETEAWIRWSLAGYAEHGFGLWAAILKDDNQFAGECGLVAQQVEGQREVEIGYHFLRKYWGQGLATEAARACRDYGFHVLGHRRLISLIDPGNIASRRVAEHVGMTLEKEIELWNKRICVYAIQGSESSL